MYTNREFEILHTIISIYYNIKKIMYLNIISQFSFHLNSSCSYVTNLGRYVLGLNLDM